MGVVFQIGGLPFKCVCLCVCAGGGGGVGVPPMGGIGFDGGAGSKKIVGWGETLTITKPSENRGGNYEKSMLFR